VGESTEVAALLVIELHGGDCNRQTTA
jgi:hypothetical protein